MDGQKGPESFLNLKEASETGVEKNGKERVYGIPGERLPVYPSQKKRNSSSIMLRFTA